jgi:thiosulfate dehydrogenase [quinone] large subunit
MRPTIIAPSRRGDDPTSAHGGEAPAFVNTLRRPEMALLPLRVFLALGWLRAGAEKLVDPTWWNGDQLRSFLTEHAAEIVPVYEPFARGVVEPLAAPVTWLVTTTQVLIGVAILLGYRFNLAVAAGIVLNFHFMLAGSVNPSIFYIAIGVTLILGNAGAVASVDRASRVPARTPTTVTAGIALLVAAASAPFARTLDLAHVVEDPPLMVAAAALLCAFAAALLWVRRTAEAAAGTADGRVGVTLEIP